MKVRAKDKDLDVVIVEKSWNSGHSSGSCSFTLLSAVSQAVWPCKLCQGRHCAPSTRLALCQGLIVSESISLLNAKSESEVRLMKPQAGRDNKADPSHGGEGA
ncbi:hypothetical protein TREES_T100015079 [Tupaia chinensis]|uniref:Uncharacterized protein n=1 Tax=Tupaia chinensis TaxID=246437 RepID=L9KJJ2_TUPCH|nr:hypothetical protein TREES_T100015079 [Tupaia chinensis]